MRETVYILSRLVQIYTFSLYVFNTVPCQWRYEEFGTCTKTCGGGTKTRFPVIRTPAQHGGDCPQHVTNRVPDIETCNTQPCPSENEHSVKTVKAQHCVLQKVLVLHERKTRKTFIYKIRV